MTYAILHSFYLKLYILFYLSSAVFMKGKVCLHQEKTGGCVCGVCVRITDSRARLWKQSFFPSSLHSRWFSGEPPRCSSKTAGRDLQCTLGYHSAQGLPCHIVPAHLLLCFTSQAWTPPKPPRPHTPQTHWTTFRGVKLLTESPGLI